MKIFYSFTTIVSNFVKQGSFGICTVETEEDLIGFILETTKDLNTKYNSEETTLDILTIIPEPKINILSTNIYLDKNYYYITNTGDVDIFDVEVVCYNQATEKSIITKIPKMAINRNYKIDIDHEEYKSYVIYSKGEFVFGYNISNKEAKIYEIGETNKHGEESPIFLIDNALKKD